MQKRGRAGSSDTQDVRSCLPLSSCLEQTVYTAAMLVSIMHRPYEPSAYMHSIIALRGIDTYLDEPLWLRVLTYVHTCAQVYHSVTLGDPLAITAVQADTSS